MSRGPGRLQRVLAQVFSQHPEGTFSTSELVPIAYPGVNRIEKKHRVALLRAAYAVARRMHWWSFRSEQPGGDIIFCNSLNLKSYTVGRARADFISNSLSLEQLIREIDCPTLVYTKKWHDMLREGSAWHTHVEINRLRAAGDHEGAAQLSDALERNLAPLLRQAKVALGVRP